MNNGVRTWNLNEIAHKVGDATNIRLDINKEEILTSIELEIF